jgi:hypothetical protein
VLPLLAAAHLHVLRLRLVHAHSDDWEVTVGALPLAEGQVHVGGNRLLRGGSRPGSSGGSASRALLRCCPFASRGCCCCRRLLRVLC